MPNNYIKISQLPIRDINSVLGENNLITGKLYSIDNKPIDLSTVLSYVISDNHLPANTIKCILDYKQTGLKFNFTTKNSEENIGITPEINGEVQNYLEVNPSLPVQINVENGNFYNEIIINPFSLSDAINQDVIKTLTIDRQPLILLEINDSGITELNINKCNKLTSCNFSLFSNIETFKLIGTNCSGNLRIGTFSRQPNIIINNNKITHLEIIGNDTNLDTSNCIITNVNSICFINCNVDNELTNLLEQNNCKIINLKRADF